MPFGWLVLTVLTTCAALAAVAVAVRASPSGRAELAILSALGFFALIEAPVLVLGYTRQLYAPRLAIASLAMSAVAFLASARGRGVGLHARDVGRAVLSLAQMPFDAIREAARARSAVLLGLVACAAIVATTAWLSYLAPAEGWDALFYHEPIVGFAIQEHGFSVIDLPPNPMVQQVNGYPRGAEAVPIWFCIFTDRTFIEIGNTLAAPWLVVAVFAIARRYGDRVSSMGWGAVTLFIPALWSQMRHAYIDVEITFFVIAALHFATRLQLRVVDVACMFLAIALLVAGKGTGLAIAPPIAFVAYVRLLMHHGRTRKWTALGLVVGGTLLVAGIASLTVVKNIVVFKNPIWPVTYDMDSLGIHLKGLIKYKAMNPAPPIPEMLRIKYGAPSGDVGDIISRDYGVAVPWIVVPLGLVALVVATLAAARDAVLRQFGPTTNLGLVAVLGFVAFMTSNSWMSARFNIEPICVLMFAIVWLCKKPRWTRLGEAAVASAIAMSLVSMLWVKDWNWGLTSQKIHDLQKAAPADRPYMYSDPGNMPSNVGRLRETELGPGDRVAFTQDETWIGTLWNFRFSNHVKYVPFDDATQFANAIEAYRPKWVVVGGSGGARSVLDQRPLEWEYLGAATPNDGTVVFQRRGGDVKR